MTASTRPRPDARLILALVAALIVAGYDSCWLARPVKDLVPKGIRPDWLSHVKARVLPALLAAVTVAMRKGRPPAERPKAGSFALDQDLAHVREQLAIRRGAEKKHKVGEWLVEVQGRFHREHGLGVEAFCRAIDISERTFRSWRARAVRPQAPAPAQPIKSTPKPRGEGRFDLDRTLPGIQQMADTTDWQIMGIGLKVAAAQDPGDRKRNLWSSFRVGLVDTGQVVLDLESEVLLPGSQIIHDRGKPYMSAEVAQGLDALGAERAPCKEYSPTEKATCERSFRTVKETLAPVVAFLDEIADRMPELKCPKIAVTLGGLLLGLFHRAYDLGHEKFRHPLAGQDEQVLHCIAQIQRQEALSDFRSKLSTLERIHGQYGMAISKQEFVRAHRAHALEDIVETERRMRRAATNEGIRTPHRYFAAILNSVADEARPRRRHELELRKERAQQDKEHRASMQRLAYLNANPIAMLCHGLDLLASQWRGTAFFLDGIVGHGWIESAIQAVAHENPFGFEDEVRVECRRWHAGRTDPRPPLDVVFGIVDQHIAAAREAMKPPDGASAILR